ncbi:MAG: lactate dehydrogenase [Planctomycetes bacterium]|nr:lactate dehydrogenase [Planctomycetota bacterium]
MDIAIVGAGGTIGRQIAVTLVQEGIVPATGRLQLVGRRGGASERRLPGMVSDLGDAFAERLPEVDIAFEPEDLIADLVIIAGAEEPGNARSLDRGDMARRNRPIFERYADQLANHGHGEELVLIVTNPVELGVEIFSRRLPRQRVIGMGAYLDTMRFRREIASELGVRRQDVQGLVVGEHGLAMVPCWSTVSAWGHDSEDGRERIDRLRRPHDPAPAAAWAEIQALTERAGPEAAYRRCAEFGADLRTLVKPLVTQLCGARTPLGTGQMIARLVQTILDGDLAQAAAQVRLEGEFLGITGVTGAPVVISNRGIERIEALAVSPAEEAGARAAAERSRALIAEHAP